MKITVEISDLHEPPMRACAKAFGMTLEEYIGSSAEMGHCCVLNMNTDDATREFIEELRCKLRNQGITGAASAMIAGAKL